MTKFPQLEVRVSLDSIFGIKIKKKKTGKEDNNPLKTVNSIFTTLSTS